MHKVGNLCIFWVSFLTFYVCFFVCFDHMAQLYNFFSLKFGFEGFFCLSWGPCGQKSEKLYFVLKVIVFILKMSSMQNRTKKWFCFSNKAISFLFIAILIIPIWPPYYKKLSQPVNFHRNRSVTHLQLLLFKNLLLHNEVISKLPCAH